MCSHSKLVPSSPSLSLQPSPSPILPPGTAPPPPPTSNLHSNLGYSNLGCSRVGLGGSGPLLHSVMDGWWDLVAPVPCLMVAFAVVVVHNKKEQSVCFSRGAPNTPTKNDSRHVSTAPLWLQDTCEIRFLDTMFWFGLVLAWQCYTAMRCTQMPPQCVPFCLQWAHHSMAWCPSYCGLLHNPKAEQRIA